MIRRQKYQLSKSMMNFFWARNRISMWYAKDRNYGKAHQEKSKKYTPDIHSSRFREGAAGAALHLFLIFTRVEIRINGLISARQSNEIELTQKIGPSNSIELSITAELWFFCVESITSFWRLKLLQYKHVYMFIVTAEIPEKWLQMRCGPEGGVLPHIAYTGMCRWTGYGFWPLCPKQGMWFRASLC